MFRLSSLIRRSSHGLPSSASASTWVSPSLAKGWMFVLVFALGLRSVVVNGAAIQIHDENLEETLVGKKATFMMFYGSQCQDCIDVMPEWTQLAEEWEGHPYGQIAQIDCEMDGADGICEYFQIQELPTFVVGGSMEWDFYGGSLDWESLSEFAKASISKPICSAYVPENCLEEDLAILAPLQSKSTDELLGLYDSANDHIAALYDQYRRDEAKLLNDRVAAAEEFQHAMEEAAGDEFPFSFVLNEWRHRIRDTGMEEEEDSFLP